MRTGTEGVFFYTNNRRVHYFNRYFTNRSKGGILTVSGNVITGIAERGENKWQKITYRKQKKKKQQAGKCQD